MVLAMRIIQWLFFIGLIGCALVIVVSWVSIFKDGFSDRGDTH